jgi:ribosomal protein S27AE
MSDEDLIDPDEGAEEPEEVLCGACGSADIQRRPRLMYFALVAVVAVGLAAVGDQTETAFFVVVTAAIFSVISDRWRCGECGNTWK